MTLTPELIEEGIARELINRIQNIRKDSGLEITDRIEVSIQKDTTLEAAVTKNKGYILSEILGNTISFENQVNEGVLIEFDQISTQINIKKTVT
jgi:isoleucyl-tRNA synthetase